MKESSKDSVAKESSLQGVSLSEGIAIGVPFFMDLITNARYAERGISSRDIEWEISRYRHAISSSKRELTQLHDQLSQEGALAAQRIIETHIEMLGDDALTTHVEEQIRHHKQRTEVIFLSVVTKYKEKLDHSNHAIFQDRVIDIADVSQRVLNYLSPHKRPPQEEIPTQAIVFSHEITPSQIASAALSNVCAFITYVGGPTSHVALIARSRKIPFISQVPVELLQMQEIERVLANGNTGQIVLNPSEQTQKRHFAKKVSFSFKEEGDEPAITLDGSPISVKLNCSSLDDLGALRSLKVDGVGLFRTEFLLVDNEELLVSEKMQHEIYGKIYQRTRGQPPVMRAFDIGGDKYPYLTSSTARGIALLLQHPELLKAQVRALLQAAAPHPLHLLLPHVTDLSQVQQTRALLAEWRPQNSPEPQVGVLVETKEAVEQIDTLACESDFLSIGTNDLIESILGIDRKDVSDIDAAHRIWPIIERIIDAAHRANKTVMICGEMAADPTCIPRLLQLGIDSLSCPPHAVARVKQSIRFTRLQRKI